MEDFITFHIKYKIILSAYDFERIRITWRRTARNSKYNNIKEAMPQNRHRLIKDSVTLR